jgi:CRP-like cAMP-binding protein
MLGRFPNAPLISKFESLGVSKEEVDALLKLLVKQSGVSAGADIVRAEESNDYATCLLSGAACSYTRLDNGTRQIYSFLYSGDFCDLHRYILPERDKTLAVQALVDCSISTIAHSEIDLLLIKYPRLHLAFWRAAMLEVSILRQWLSNARQGLAVQRVANLLCELLVRREAIGIASRILPITQIDVADAAALSAVHVNRTIKMLRKWNVLSTASHAIEVIDRKQLAKIGGFDGRYLERNGVSSGRDGVGALSGGTQIEVRSRLMWAPGKRK